MPPVQRLDSAQRLSDAWNALRNAALGRGTTPNVSPALAAEVVREQEAWAALLRASPELSLQSLEPWRAVYRRVRAKVQQETGIEDLPEATSVVHAAAEKVEEVVSEYVPTVALVLGAGILAYVLGSTALDTGLHAILDTDDDEDEDE